MNCCHEDKCNKESKFKVWLHRSTTLDSLFCSDKCLIKYAKRHNWKLKDNKLTRYANEEINL